MADAINGADDRVAALDHAIDPHESVLLATIVVHKLGAHARGHPAQVLDRPAATADIKDAPRDRGADSLVAGLCTRTGLDAGWALHPLLPAETLELLLKIGNHALGCTCPLARAGKGTLAPGRRRFTASFTRIGHRYERNRCPCRFAQLRAGRVALEHDLAMPLTLTQQFGFEVVEAGLKLARTAGILVRHPAEHVAEHVDVTEDARAKRAGDVRRTHESPVGAGDTPAVELFLP